MLKEKQEKPRAELLKNMKAPTASAAEVEADEDLDALLGDSGDAVGGGEELEDAPEVASPLGEFSDEDLLAELHARGLVDMGGAGDVEAAEPAVPKK